MNAYEILEIKYNADKEEIQKAYRSLAKRFHPDICKEPGAVEKMKLINAAYDLLMKPQPAQPVIHRQGMMVREVKIYQYGWQSTDSCTADSSYTTGYYY